MTAIQNHFDNRRPAMPDNVLRPRVEIFEDKDGIQMYADLPGVKNDRIKLEIDSDTLVLDAEANIDMPEQLKPLHVEVESRHYRRAFTLSSELDGGAITASMNDGVLSVRIPKRQELQPRRIEVKVG